MTDRPSEASRGPSAERFRGSTSNSKLMANDTTDLDRAGKQAAYITDEWTTDPAIMQTQALCYVGLQLERIADALEDDVQDQ
ncbi:hypothetical protein C492_13586 [Natronococcus jeotgali DSM 18795]|uniref:Uncharacterized protein n=2 Tax=Natronococcus jeotgali TaxID=413812 RepID=L9X7C8_9EURY|nr:hypothetical protein C492_13586 [Natronococcus jeotgali DSM 18795]